MEGLKMILAIGKDGAIGRGGDLIWKIPADLKRFKELTTGGAVIMGRKTWDSLPKKPLPNRRNVVLTRQSDFKAEGAEVVNDLNQALHLTKDEKTFIIGGAEVYNAFLPYVSEIYLTEVDADCPDADAFLNLDGRENWETVEISPYFDTSDGLSFRYVKLRRLDNIKNLAKFTTA